ncbi:hypothetical protein [Tsukamurella soli]|uniref:Uncharacterized protein n=1 Tax=Tsukamurella soli TaxID=644556 RepID=A0ABP8KD65_9ACTN
MTGMSTKAGVTRRPRVSDPARRVRTIVAGRQTRTDIAVATTLLGVSVIATLLNLMFAAAAFPGLNRCVGGACGDHAFDVITLSLIVSLVVGTTFGFHAVLKLLSRRNAWLFALADAVVSIACVVLAVALGSSGIPWIA